MKRMGTKIANIAQYLWNEWIIPILLVALIIGAFVWLCTPVDVPDGNVLEAEPTATPDPVIVWMKG